MSEKLPPPVCREFPVTLEGRDVVIEIPEALLASVLLDAAEREDGRAGASHFSLRIRGRRRRWRVTFRRQPWSSAPGEGSVEVLAWTEKAARGLGAQKLRDLFRSRGDVALPRPGAPGERLGARAWPVSVSLDEVEVVRVGRS